MSRVCPVKHFSMKIEVFDFRIMEIVTHQCKFGENICMEFLEFRKQDIVFCFAWSPRSPDPSDPKPDVFHVT